jgi:hypothetical protein
MNFHTLDYLKKGNMRQQRAYDILTKYKIFEILREFEPFLAGTIPIEIDLPESDLDVLCSWKDRDNFIVCLADHFSGMPKFSWKTTEIQGRETVITTLRLDGVMIEIFGQDVPVQDQFGYRHLFIEHRLLLEQGYAFREEIIRLKKSGMKTEPAFAHLLQLKGDPYLALLEMK